MTLTNIVVGLNWFSIAICWWAIIRNWRLHRDIDKLHTEAEETLKEIQTIRSNLMEGRNGRH